MADVASGRAARAAWGAFAGLAGGGALTFGATLASVPVAAAAVAGVAVLAAMLVSPAAAFLATVFVIPVERLGRLTPDSAMYTISLMRIVGVIALASFLLHALARRWRIHFELPHFTYAIYFGFAVAGVLYSTDQLGTVRASGAILGNLLFFFLVTNMIRDFAMARRAVAVWLAATSAVCIYTIYTWHFVGGFTESEIGEAATRFSTVLEDVSEYELLETVARATGPTSHSAVYGINLILTLPFLLWFLGEARTRAMRLALAGGLALVLYNVLLTNTRAAILLALGVLGLCVMRGLGRLRAGALAAGAVACVAVLPLIPEAVYERVLDPSNYTLERSGTLRARLDFWEAGLKVAADHWAIGIGVGNQQVIPQYVRGDGPRETTVHNDYLMTLMEVGLAGWIVFFGFVYIVTRAAFRAATRYRAAGLESEHMLLVACQIATLAVLLYAVQVDVFHFPLKGWWLVAGIGWVMWRIAPTPASADAAHRHGGLDR